MACLPDHVLRSAKPCFRKLPAHDTVVSWSLASKGAARYLSSRSAISNVHTLWTCRNVAASGAGPLVARSSLQRGRQRNACNLVRNLWQLRQLKSTTCQALFFPESNSILLDWSTYSLQSSFLAHYLFTAAGVLAAYLAGSRRRGSASEQAIATEHGSSSDPGRRQNTDMRRSWDDLIVEPRPDHETNAAPEEWLPKKEKRTSSRTAGLEADHSWGLPGGSPMLTLAGLAHGPRWRLLAVAATQLRSEVAGISADARDLSPDAWSALCSTLLQRVVATLMAAWLDGEQAEAGGSGEVRGGQARSDGEGRASCTFAEGDNWSLHTQLVYSMRFQRQGPAASPAPLAALPSPSLLFDDMVVSVAEAVSKRYLDQVASADEDGPLLVLPRLASTRALEGFRNEIALRRWLHRNFSSVVAMYEDRHELWAIRRPTPAPAMHEDASEGLRQGGTLWPGCEAPWSVQANSGARAWSPGPEGVNRGAEKLEEEASSALHGQQPVPLPLGGRQGQPAAARRGRLLSRRSARSDGPWSRVEQQGHGTPRWWGGWAFQRRHVAQEVAARASEAGQAAAEEVWLGRHSVRRRRTAQLRSLQDWRLAVCLYLEFSDVVGPLLRAVVAKLGQGLSFLLVAFIGRSLGLIYRGIKQSFRPSRK